VRLDIISKYYLHTYYIMSFFRAQRAQTLRSSVCSSSNLAICTDFRRIGVNQITYEPPVTAPSGPLPPTGLTYSFNGTSVILLFTPGSDNGSPITNYQYSTNGTTFTSLNTTTLPLTISGLTTGTTYSITVQAVNANGPGTSSEPISVTTVTKIPGSLRFNGTNKITMNPAVTIGTNPYTVECWFYNTNNWTTSVSSNIGLLGCETNGDTGGLNVFFSSNTTITTDRNGGGLQPLYTFATAFKLNTWQHFALVRDSNNRETVFIDGIRASSAAGGTGAVTGGYQINTGNRSGDTGGYSGRSDQIGRFYQGYFTGFLANFRIVVGTAVYDPTLSTCTVPTSALTNITNTKYLMTGSTVTNDGSSTQTVTNTGGVTVSTTIVPF